MPDLFLNDPTPTRTRRRAFRIEIDNPQTTTKHIHYHQEDVQVTQDDSRLAAVPAPSIDVTFDELATVVREVYDPVTGLTTPISGAAVAAWIEADYLERAESALRG